MGDVGLVLTGGGARAAYQVGALRAISHIRREKLSPFRIFAGVSAGAINAISMAAGADEFQTAAAQLTDVWHGLTPDRVYRTDARGLLNIGTRWIKDLSAGGLLGSSRINYLLDTAPLRDLLAHVLPVSRLTPHLRNGLLRGVAVSTTSYATGMAVTFFDGARDVQPWFRRTRVGVREKLRLPHVLASAAIPIFFPPVKIRGLFYGDGCVRMNSPLSPAIHLGAERILAIGVQSLPPVELPPERSRAPRRDWLPPSEIAGVLLNAVFLDSLEADVERLERVNRTISFIPPDQRGTPSQPLRAIPTLVLRPSQDLGTLAADQYSRFPRMLRYLLKGIGATGETGSDLLSYLAFEPEYVDRLMELGYADTMRSRTEVEAFLEPVEAAAAAGG
ncbi:MAG TPA: patatin-like phospholipase family protein [Anaeromyxobacteraceae bacterium]|nr:patatin-like phospholipase family protein [Anaeromyxobacteraceae bacterium]